ncbi:hypothetical protein SI65_06056 [Aspergillus cristatus]|uniref:NIMA interactive protein n=1 Tax=Aspergillus cristatus TaxID=573508 RepID=A0A1E3BB44_ASPCR|nr:hypothetical protein SI65_06056 [Aspergillus cristatus]
MEPHNLNAASSYINNVLLARGLLKGGTPIDFAQPENDEGGVDGTMARVINLVNDLVLRRDREADHRENLATTIRTLRANESQQSVEIGKLRTKTSEMSRSLALAEAQERALRTNIASAESTIRNMKEQVQRMKTTVQQVRAQCANDIRKRDLELQKLKSHLAERQRGKREGLGVTTININPTVDRASRSKTLSGGEGINNPGYSLKQETNEFLTQLCQTLSDENDMLIALARNTVQTLKDLQGLPHEDEENPSGTASSGTQKSSHDPVTILPTSCDELSAHMGMMLEHLQTLLTNPSFVPLEEVEVRDEEINRLREGWEKMESRWRQAVTVMDGWHTRIADGGDSVQAEELKMGLGLSIDSAHASATNDADINMESPILEDQQAEEEEEEAERKSKQSSQQRAPSKETKPTGTRETRTRRAASRALKERSDNIQSGRSRKVSFTPGLNGSPCVNEDETLQVKAHKSEAVTRRALKKRVEANAPRKDPPSRGRVTLSQKLAMAEDDARAAEQDRKESQSRKRSRGTGKEARDRRRSTLTSDELDELMGRPSPAKVS